MILRDDSRVADNTAARTGGGIEIASLETGSRLELRDRHVVALPDAGGMREQLERGAEPADERQP